MSFEDFASTCSRTFSQTPIRLIRMSSPLTSYVGATHPSYRAQILLCQSHFTSKTISIAFYLNGTAYFENLTEDKIRQRLQVLNNSRQTSFHKEKLNSILSRLREMLKSDGNKHELHAKLLSARLLSIELSQDDFKFKFRCDERPELFEQHYVRQLLIQVKELSQRQNYLCELLEHKDQLPQFDAKLFLSTPMTLAEDDEGNDSCLFELNLNDLNLDDEDDDEILSSSSVVRLWKSVFGRHAEPFLDVCLLKKAYLKVMEDEDEDDQITVSNVVETLIDQVENQISEQEIDELGLAKRLKKRLSTANIYSSAHYEQNKRLRSNPIENESSI